MQIECLFVLILPLFIDGGAQSIRVQTKLFHFKVIEFMFVHHGSR